MNTMLLQSTAILERFRRGRPGDIDLTLRPAYCGLLAKLDNPHKKLPPVFHVAGTNGKGSTCAFLRAILEAAGHKVHVYTSPHLVRFHERIRIAGDLIAEDELVSILTECEHLAEPGGVTYFEAATAAALTAFARHPADFTILETGLGGRLDATNIIDKPLTTIITRLSYDHREYLGDTLEQIAREKAGIMRPGVPCFTIRQPDAESMNALQACAAELGAPLHIVDDNWQKDFPDATLSLTGRHQFENAGLAIAAFEKIPNPESRIPNAIFSGLKTAQWPARLQKLETGALRDLLPRDYELWLDGGHNDSAGEILAAQARAWQQDGAPLHLVTGMITTKTPKEFLAPLAPYIASLQTLAIPDEPQSFSAHDLANLAKQVGISNIFPAADVQTALHNIHQTEKSPARILICGSLYLAGYILKHNEK